METGTGKTYVYIKTMFELNKQYGWSKFILCNFNKAEFQSLWNEINHQYVYQVSYDSNELIDKVILCR